MKSEYAFTLPRGLVDSAGTVHREGTMRLATARDEIEPLRSIEAVSYTHLTLPTILRV